MLASYRIVHCLPEIRLSAEFSSVGVCYILKRYYYYVQEFTMRFMMLMIPKGYEDAAPGTMPDAKAVEAMMKYNEDVQEAAAGFAEMHNSATKK